MYALAYHYIPSEGGTLRDLAGVRYIDQYRHVNGRWRFAKRVVSFDFRDIKPAPTPASSATANDPSYSLVSRLFARGPRA